MNSRYTALSHLLTVYPHQCHWCGCYVHRVPDCVPYGATVEHLLPKSRGGRTEQYDGYWNVRLACRQCNELRSAAGHCMAALACARAVLGTSTSQGKIQRWLAGKQPERSRVFVMRAGNGAVTLGDACPQLVALASGA